MDDKPRLRPIELLPLSTEKGTVVCLRDVRGISDRVVTVSPGALYVLQMLDGQHTVLDIQADLTRRSGQLVSGDDIRRMIGVLDEALLMEGERFETFSRRLRDEFAAAPVRSPRSAGHAYPADAKELGAFLDAILAETPVGGAKETGPLRALIAPHIDHPRGRTSYAAAFARLAADDPADLYVLLGTAHADTEKRFALTRKDFETPLGVARTDAAFVDALAKRAGDDLFRDEFAHRGEHSIELVLVLLQHVLAKSGADFRIVPILCGSHREAIAERVSPEKVPGVREALDALRGMVEAEKRRIVFIAGADLSHVGPRFGGERPVTELTLSGLDRADRQTLAFVEKGDAEGFYGHVALDDNARNICGVAPIYTLLKTSGLPGLRLLDYGQWCEDDGSSCVTFAACAG
jgi:hypothetical protein